MIRPMLFSEMAIDALDIETRTGRQAESDESLRYVVEKLTSGVVSVAWTDPRIRRYAPPCRHYRIGIRSRRSGAQAL